VTPSGPAVTPPAEPPAAAPPAAAPVVAAAPPVAATAPPPSTPEPAAPETSPSAPTVALGDPASLAAPASEAAPPAAAALPRLDDAPSPAPPAAEPALPGRVFIHYPRSASAAAEAARDALASAGMAEVEIVPVRYAIGRSNIRYYHDADRGPAASLAPLVAGALGGEPPEARDFTDYATPAAPGTVEIWLAGDPGPSATRSAAGRRAAAETMPATPRRTAPSTPTSAPDTPFQMPGVIAPAPTRAEQVERILIERLRQGR
jgi:hypothetical protein